VLGSPAVRRKKSRPKASTVGWSGSLRAQHKPGARVPGRPAHDGRPEAPSRGPCPTFRIQQSTRIGGDSFACCNKLGLSLLSWSRRIRGRGAGLGQRVTLVPALGSKLWSKPTRESTGRFYEEV